MKTVTFLLREYCEVVALKTIIQWFKELEGTTEIQWQILPASVNTDFNFCRLDQSFGQESNVKIIGIDQIQSNQTVFGFKTDMRHDYDQLVTRFFNCFEVASCRLYRRAPLRLHHDGVRSVVVGNVKVKCPIEEFQLSIFQKLTELPYRIIIVPRHPLIKEEVDRLNIPKGLDFQNTLGALEGLYATTDLAIMGRLFCFDGLKPDDDHNPLEATINGNAICGVNSKIPAAYTWLYEYSGLLHQCSKYEEVFDLVDVLLHDRDLDEKLFQRQRWVLANRQQYLKPIGEVIRSSIVS